MPRKKSALPAVRTQKYTATAISLHAGMMSGHLTNEEATRQAVLVGSAQTEAWGSGFGGLRTAYENQISPMLDAQGMKGPIRAVYRAFYNELHKQSASCTADAFPGVVTGLVGKYTGYGGDSGILSAIAQVFGAKVTPQGTASTP